MNLDTFLQIMNVSRDLTVDEILDMFIIYLRKSRKDMDYYKDESIEKTLQRHEKELQDFIVSIFGKPIPEYNIYREVASGDTIEDRPVIQEVLSLIEEDRVNRSFCREGTSFDERCRRQAICLFRAKFSYANPKMCAILYKREEPASRPHERSDLYEVYLHLQESHSERFHQGVCREEDLQALPLFSRRGPQCCRDLLCGEGLPMHGRDHHPGWQHAAARPDPGSRRRHARRHRRCRWLH